MVNGVDKNKLLVEGASEKRVIPYLLDEHIVWGNAQHEWPVDIVAYEGVEDLLADGEIQTQLKSSGLETLGIIVDADTSIQSRGESIRHRCTDVFPNLPKDLPEKGLIHVNDAGLKIGVWIMPDNIKSGMLETFLACLVPEEGGKVWEDAREYLTSAKASGAEFKDVHEDKAAIHAWLAVQDPPGESLHVAVFSKILKAGSPNGDSFVNWFVSLFGVNRR